MSLQRVTSAHAECWHPSMSRPQWCPTAVRPLPVAQALRCSLRHQGRSLAASTRLRGCPTSPQPHLGLPKQHLARCRAVSSSSASEHGRGAGAASGVAGVPAEQSGAQPAASTWGDYWQLLLPDWSRMLACGAFTLLSVACTIAVGPAIGQGAPLPGLGSSTALADPAASDCHAPLLGWYMCIAAPAQ